MYFSINEFFKNCSDSERNEVFCSSVLTGDLFTLFSRLDVIRGAFGSAIIINSGYRNVEHNKRVGGVNNSWHTKMCAVDIRPQDPKLMQSLVEILAEFHDFFPEMIIHRGYVHLSIKD